jgi:hypothetical protein
MLYIPNKTKKVRYSSRPLVKVITWHYVRGRSSPSRGKGLLLERLFFVLDHYYALFRHYYIVIITSLLRHYYVLVYGYYTIITKFQKIVFLHHYRVLVTIIRQLLQKCYIYRKIIGQSDAVVV